MTEVAEQLGTRHGPFRGRLDPDVVRAYAAATNDESAAVRAGRAVSATFPVVLVFDAQTAANADVPPMVWEHARTGVHGEHDIVLHRPLVPGETIDTWSRLAALRATRAGTRAVLHMEQYDERGALVAEQWWTTLLLGAGGGAGAGLVADAGAEPPDHTFPDAARDRPVSSGTQFVDCDIARRYAEVSNDWSAHHFDRAAAQRAGADDVFAHGLCTMAMCAQFAVQRVAGGDPGRVRRVAVRFASPRPLGADLRVDMFDAGAGTYAFEATGGGATVGKHGRVELRET
jgi:acyl dehydratase